MSRVRFINVVLYQTELFCSNDFSYSIRHRSQGRITSSYCKVQAAMVANEILNEQQSQLQISFVYNLELSCRSKSK